MHKKRHFLMSQYRSLSRHTWNLKNTIFWKPLEVTSSSFQDCLLFMIPTTGKLEQNLRGMGDMTWMIRHAITQIPKLVKQVRFFPCANCIYHKNGYFKECLSFSFKLEKKLLTWHYKRLFSCDSKDISCLLIRNNCQFFNIAQFEGLKHRTWKHKSDEIHPNNSNYQNIQSI